MSGVLLVDGSEALQSFVQELERAGFSIDACQLDDAVDRVSSAPHTVAVLVDMIDGEPRPALRRLLGAGVLPTKIATIAVLPAGQLTGFDAELLFDDFVVCSAGPDELVARVQRAVARRADAEASNVLRCGDLTIDQSGYKVFVAGRPVELTFREYELLRFLALNRDRVCTREMLLSQVWGYDFYGGARTVDVHIRRLRSKIESGGHTFIETVRNVGYRVRAD